MAVAVASTSFTLDAKTTKRAAKSTQTTQKYVGTDTSLMNGAIGQNGIKMKLWFNESNHTITGWYYYKSKGANNKIQLKGTYDGDILYATLVVNEISNGKVTGTFKGDFSYGTMTGHDFDGTWTSSAGKVLKFAVGDSR